MTTNEETNRVRQHYDRVAGSYDRFIVPFERIFFGEGREWACSQARGEVLEIAAGAGRNLAHYPKRKFFRFEREIPISKAIMAFHAGSVLTTTLFA